MLGGVELDERLARQRPEAIRRELEPDQQLGQILATRRRTVERADPQGEVIHGRLVIRPVVHAGDAIG
jgi:hypothetical protein